MAFGANGMNVELGKAVGLFSGELQDRSRGAKGFPRQISKGFIRVIIKPYNFCF